MDNNPPSSVQSSLNTSSEKQDTNCDSSCTLNENTSLYQTRVDQGTDTASDTISRATQSSVSPFRPDPSLCLPEVVPVNVIPYQPRIAHPWNDQGPQDLPTPRSGVLGHSLTCKGTRRW